MLRNKSISKIGMVFVFSIAGLCASLSHASVNVYTNGSFQIAREASEAPRRNDHKVVDDRTSRQDQRGTRGRENERRHTGDNHSGTAHS